MKQVLIAAMVVLFMAGTTDARPRLFPRTRQVTAVRGSVQKGPQTSAVQKGPQALAEQKAQQKASMGNKGHIGGGFGGANAEGVGFSTRSAADALANCCFAGRRPCVGAAVVRGRDGWYAVRLYR